MGGSARIVSEAVFGLGVTNDVNAVFTKSGNVPRRRIGIAIPDDGEHSIGMTGREQIQWLSMSRSSPGLGKPDHSVETADPGETIR